MEDEPEPAAVGRTGTHQDVESDARRFPAGINLGICAACFACHTDPTGGLYAGDTCTCTCTCTCSDRTADYAYTAVHGPYTAGYASASPCAEAYGYSVVGSTGHKARETGYSGTRTAAHGPCGEA